MEGIAADLAASSVRLWPSSPIALEAIYKAQDLVASVAEGGVQTEHVFHAGMYARTIRMPAGMVGVGTLIKVPTLLIVHGDVDLLTGDGWIEIRGYGVLPGSAGRKQVFVTRSDVEMTMLFATQARTVEDAEREFTDEFEMLMSRQSESDTVLVTGE